MAKAHPYSSIPKADLVSLYRKALLENVSLEKIDQKAQHLWQRAQVTASVEAEESRERATHLKKQLPALVRVGAFVVPLFFISVGLFLVGNAVIPILNYYVTTLPTLTANNLTSPIPPEKVLDITPVVIAQAQTENDDATATASTQSDLAISPTIIDEQLDYTNLANWFGSATIPELASGVPAADSSEYTIDIPKVKIEAAVVKMGGTDLDKSLIQYPGTADPGQPGAPVIFGHSVLRQFYNPSLKNPRRYVSIFSYIMTLKNGDEIVVTRDGVKYTYIVRDKKEVKPEDVHILLQNYDSRQLKLVTCTPEGTYLRRGVVTAELVPGGG